MINRTALIIRPKEPYLQWTRSLSGDGIEPDPSGEQTVYLLPEFEDDAGFERILKKVWQELFERELEGWYLDESRWPQNRTFAMFKKWFSIEYHTVIEDLCDFPIEDDEF